MMWVKICGNTNLPDCLLAAELGADAVGFVFAPGRRTVTAAQVASITPHLPHALETIGVFTSTDFDVIAGTVEAAGLTGVQLHGPLDFRLLERLRVHFGDQAARISVIQVLPWYTDLSAEEQGEAFSTEVEAVAEDGSADALLIDSRTRDRSGGTGVPFNWSAASGILHRVDYRVIVAGGLTHGNVAEAIHTLQPWGVDVVSGVERSAGLKDPTRMADFIQNARHASPPDNRP